MQYYSSLEGVFVFDQTQPFFYYLIGPTIFIPPLRVVISPYKFSFLLTRHFLSNSFSPIQDTVHWSLLSIPGWPLPTETLAPNNPRTHVITNFVHVNKWYSVRTRIRQIVHPNTQICYPVVNVYPVIPYQYWADLYTAYPTVNPQTWFNKKS